MPMQQVLRVGELANQHGSSQIIITDGDSTPRGGSASLTSVLSAFVPTVLVGLLFIAIFVLIRQIYPKIYAPRTFIGTIPEKDRTPSASHSYFNWAHTLRVLPDKFLLYHSSLDAYLYLRFLRTIILICVVGSCITWPILLPINATGGGVSTELDKLSIGNVVINERLYAHAVVAWVFFGFIMFTVARERIWLIGLRQAWILAKPNAKRLSSRTVLYLSAPREALEESNLTRYFGNDAVRCWPATKAHELESLVSERDALVEKLEAAEVALTQRAHKAIKKEKRKLSTSSNSEVTFETLSDDVKKQLRPTHRIELPIKGEKVDSIEWYRQQITDKEKDIENARSTHKATESKGGAAVFVEFKTQATAAQGHQQVASGELLALQPRYLGVTPKQVIWDNLVMPPAVRISRETVAVGLVVATILFWSIPIAFVGAISNVTYLAENWERLRWLKRLPEPVIGLLTGLLPPFLTSLLSRYVPNIFRYIFKSFGEATTTSAELKVQKWYFVFQVLQVFLVTALSSAASSVVAAILSEILNKPMSVPTMLAERIPTSANFYLSYFIVQGTTSSTDNLLNYSDLLSWLAYDYLFDNTPRKKYNSYTSLKGTAWGKVYPKFANFAIIAIVYSCIAPLVTGFAAAGLMMFYLSYRYMFFFTVQPKMDTNGQAYTLALQHLLTGVYLAELCLIGLFGIHNATGPIVMTVVLFAVTVVYNSIMNRYFKPLEVYMPANLATEPEDEEQAPLLASSEDDQGRSNIQRLGQEAHIPPKIVDPIATFFEPRVFANRRALRTWLEEGDLDEASIPKYSDEEIRKAYMNPALTSQTPIVWLPKDPGGASKQEIRASEKKGLKTSDQGAWLNERGHIKWSDRNFDEVPLFKKDVKY